jgi:hypothetical protein
MPRETDFKQALSAHSNGFSQPACIAGWRSAGTRPFRALCPASPCTPPCVAPLTGQVVLKLKTAWRDGTTHLVMLPLECMQRLAALVPRPRLHLILLVSSSLRCAKCPAPRCANHGALAPNAKLRALVVPQVVPQEPEAPAQAARSAECDANCAHHRPVRPNWAKLLKRLFDLDLEHCPNCGGELKIIAAILRGEPGHQQSGGLLVPGEGSGHWPDAPCKGPDDSDSSPLRWLAEQGCGDRLRARVIGTDGCGAAPGANPWMTPGETPFDRAVHAQQTSACIQRQLQALRALRSAPVLPRSGRRRGEKGRMKNLSSSATRWARTSTRRTAVCGGPTPRSTAWVTTSRRAS